MVQTLTFNESYGGGISIFVSTWEEQGGMLGVGEVSEREGGLVAQLAEILDIMGTKKSAIDGLQSRGGGKMS
jgi:hypothetical protein